MGKNTYKLYNESGIISTECIKDYDKYSITLPGGFEIPVYIIVETVQYYNYTNLNTCDESHPWLVERADDYLISHMIAGTIIKRDEILDCGFGCCNYSIVYSCNEMIGQSKIEEILNLNGQNS